MNVRSVLPPAHSRVSAVWVIVALAATIACNKPRSQGEAAPNEPEKATSANPASPPESPAAPVPEEAPAEEAPADKAPGPEDVPPGDAPPTGGLVLRVFAPDGLVKAATSLGKAFAAADSEVQSVDVVASGSTTNAVAVPNLDVVIYPSWSDLEVLSAAALLDGPGKTVTHLPMGIQVSGKAADRLRRPADLAGENVKVGVPSAKRDGGAARRLIRRAGLDGKLSERTLPRGEDSALRDGTIDAWVGFYKMPVGVPMRLPAGLREHQPVAVGVLKQSNARQAASRFVEWLEGPLAQKLWTQFGTVPVAPTGLPVAPTALPVKLRVPTHKSAVVNVDGRILVIGGRSSGKPVDRLAWVDPRTSRSTELATRLPAGREGAAAIYHRENRRVLLFGGRGPGGPLNSALRIDPAAETVEALDIVLPDRRTDTTGARVGQSILLFGGRSESAILDTVVVVDLIESGASFHKVRLPYPVASAAAVAGPGGTIWIIGGESTQGPSQDMLAYAPDTGAFSRLPHRLPGPTMGHAAAPFGDGVLVVGGRTRTALRDALDYIAPDGKATRLGSRLPEPLGEPSAVALDGKVFIIGGLAQGRIAGGVVRFPY